MVTAKVMAPMTRKAKAAEPQIVVRGAREHNLQSIDLELPKKKLIVMTGVSGSGKSSLAFDTIYDRAGDVVTDASQLDFGGFNRFCSARGVNAGELSFMDDVFFTGEETSGGTQWVIDVDMSMPWAMQVE